MAVSSAAGMKAGDLARSRLGVVRMLIVAIALAMGGASASAQMPTADECAAGGAEPVKLGKHVGSGSVCVAADGHVVAYAGGNAAIPCGSIRVADSDFSSEDPNFCDSLLELPPDEVDYRVVLPSDYETSGRSYPTLYLLTSGFGDEWPTADPNLQEIADLGVIIVLNEQGLGFYNDWHNGEHQHETLHTRRLIDHVDMHYRTIPDRTQRALAGVSKAGYGAMLLAARHPDLYGVAASLSGILDIGRPGFPVIFTAQLTPGFGTYDDPTAGVDNPIFGNAVTEEVNWHNKNPTDLATNLRGVNIYASAGDGVPTPEEAEEAPGFALGVYPEAEIRLQSDNFDAALDRAGIDHTYVQRRGTHSFRFWVPELHEWAQTMMSAFADPVELPAAFDYRSADPRFSVWGWSFTADRARAMEFLDVEDASATGLELTGSGLTNVETAPLFRRRARVTVSDGAGEPHTVRADNSGRLRFTVDLGPAHEAQQYTAAARVLEQQPGYFKTRSITLTPAKGQG